MKLRVASAIAFLVLAAHHEQVLSAPVGDRLSDKLKSKFRNLANSKKPVPQTAQTDFVIPQKNWEESEAPAAPVREKTEEELKMDREWQAMMDQLNDEILEGIAESHAAQKAEAEKSAEEAAAKKAKAEAERIQAAKEAAKIKAETTKKEAGSETGKTSGGGNPMTPEMLRYALAPPRVPADSGKPKQDFTLLDGITAAAVGIPTYQAIYGDMGNYEASRQTNDLIHQANYINDNLLHDLPGNSGW